MLKEFLAPYVYYNQEAAGGGAGATGTAGDPPAQQAGQTSTGTAGGDTGGAEARFTQEEVNRFLAEEKRKFKQQMEAEQLRAKATADAEALAKAGEFQQLAEQRQVRLSQIEQELQADKERAEAYAAAMEQQLKARLKALPEEIRAMDPGGDILTRYEWVGKAEAAAQKLIQQRPAGTPGGPRGTGGAPPAGPNLDDLKDQHRARIGGL